MSTHINAKKGDFAKVVLMPGDPLRAKWIAENFLTNVKLVTDVRGILGYTGYSKNKKRISVMASGMGQPSIGIYSNELYDEYDVEAIIRVGTCGAFPKNVNVRDVIIAMGASTDFPNYLADLNLGGIYSAIADYSLLETAVNEARKAKKKVHVGNIFSSGVFYHLNPNSWKAWDRLGILGVEMESYALYANAALKRKKALCILTVSDHFQKKGVLTSLERQASLKDMIEIAIKTAEHFA